MLRLERIAIKNYGPYRNEELVFSNEPGVTIVWGNNGSGKTTLLNIIKYALFGKFFGGKYKKNPKTKTMNQDALREGEKSFSVTLKLKSDEDIYELCREQCIKDDVSDEISDSDFKEIITLKKNGLILPQESTKKHLIRILPEDISRFFLFDGELLKEYEELLEEEDSEGEGLKIKMAIEKILGVPLLKTSAQIIADIESGYEKKVSNAAQSDKRNKELLNTYNKIDEKIKNEQKDLQNKYAELNSLIEQKNNLIELMKTNKKVISLLEKKESFTTSLNEAKKEYEDCCSAIPQQISSVWCYMLKERATDAASSIDQEYHSLDQRNTAYNYLKDSVKTGICPTCGRPFEHQNEMHLEPLSIEENQRLELLRSIRKSLSSLIYSVNQYELIQTQEKRLLTLQQKIKDYNTKIQECDAEINMTSEETADIIELQDESSRCANKIFVLKENIDCLEKSINNNIKDKDNLYSKITKNGSEELEKLSRRKDTCHQILTVLNNCIDEYCLRLKQDVERDASSIFMSVDSSGHYSGLRINNNYGLELIDLDGKIVPARSSGFEHMIAISLIGGIHKNAPIEGPTIIDSPFGRIDRPHKPNVARVLPSLASQVIVLSFYGEIDENVFRNTLAGNLIEEFELNHESTYSTHINCI